MRADGRVVLNNLTEQIRECLQHAEHCARQAAAQTNSKLKEDFLELEQRWLFLARSYEFTERLTDFSDETRINCRRLSSDADWCCRCRAWAKARRYCPGHARPPRSERTSMPTLHNIA